MLSFRTRSARRNFAAIAIVLAALLSGTWIITKSATDQMLYWDAVSTADKWGKYLVQHIEDIEQIAAGEKPSPASVAFFERAQQVGHIFRYKIFNREGFLRLTSDESHPVGSDALNLGEHNAAAAQAMATGRPLVVAAEGKPPLRPSFFSEAYVPVLVDGQAVAILEAYVDQTAKREQYRFTFTIVAVALSVLTAFAFGTPAVAWYRQNRQLRRREEDLHTQNVRFDVALNNMSQGLCMYDAAQRIVVCNDRFARMYGLSPEQVKPGTTMRQIAEYRIANGIYAGSNPEEYIRERTAPVVAASTKIQELSDGRTIVVSRQPMPAGGWVTTHEDITEHRRIEAQIAHMAHHDALTDLPNRVLLGERLGQALTRVRRGGHLAVFYLDLDRFKSVNDMLGHSIGDELLKAVADRLRSCIRETDTIARLGGDEFAVIQTAIEEPTDVAALARRIREVIKIPYELNGHQVVIDTSIGITISPNDGADPSRLLKNADIALYEAKAHGRGTFRFFEPEMNARISARNALELDLRKALVNGEFELYYQPLVNLQNDEVSGVEALLRWHHPEHGTISPAEFIPVAEDMGLIVPLGEWVLRRACADAAIWPDDIKVSVNLSPVQLTSQNLVQVIVNALASAGMPAHRLELEITEAVLMQEKETTLATLHQLRGLGVRISMDDFGTGYSSLSYLRSFPFDKIKIDRSFIEGLTDRDDSLAIVRAVASLAASLNMTTTAEGVETEQQLAIVRAEGYTEMQGYLFSRPKPAKEILRLFSRRARLAAGAA